jgi:RimJ/RimL family protein N-acetyltransferase
MGDWWPIQRLRLTTPRLELRVPSYDDLLALGDVAAAGIHDPATMPFDTPWTDVSPAERARATIQWHWRAVGALKADDWSVSFAVVHAGQVIGTQEVGAREFAVRREITTGSWLGQQHHGRGIGTEMRAAVIHLGFLGLGATSATSAAFADNPASNGVSRRLGYQPDGIDIRERRGAAAEQIRYRLTRDEWAANATVPVEIHGLGDDVLELLGAADKA